MTPEELLENQNERLVEGYFKKYKPYMQSFEKSLVAKAMDISEHHLIQLGKQLDQWETYKQICEASGSLQNLGELPKVALDVITATMSSSILPVIASTQAIEEQKSIVYFKNLRADNTKGNLTAGQKIVDPRTGTVTPSGYASNQVSGEVGDVLAGATLDYSFNLAALPVRSQFLKIYVAGFESLIFGEDVGPRGTDQNIGTILGKQVSGTINYTTGLVTLRFDEDPATLEGGVVGANIVCEYQQNLELVTDLPQVTSFLDQTSIEARAYALKSVIGMFQAFALKKRFGDSALDEMTMDLTREINSEIGGDFIRAYNANAVGNVDFDLTLPAGAAYSEKQYRETYSLRMADSEAEMIANAGRGTVKVMIVGREHAALVRGLDGFQLLSDGNSLGAHIFGTYKGVTYIRVPEQALLDSKAGIGLYTGASPLESAGVYSPFMPLTVSGMASDLGNPLLESKAAATMAGIKVVVPQYATKLTVIES